MRSDQGGGSGPIYQGVSRGGATRNDNHACTCRYKANGAFAAAQQDFVLCGLLRDEGGAWEAWETDAGANRAPVCSQPSVSLPLYLASVAKRDTRVKFQPRSSLPCFFSAQSCADAAEAVCWWDLRDGLLPLCSLLGVDLAYDEWARPFCAILDRELYPDLILLVIQRMLEVVKFGSAAYQRAAITIVKEMFEVRMRAWRVGTTERQLA